MICHIPDLISISIYRNSADKILNFVSNYSIDSYMEGLTSDDLIEPNSPLILIPIFFNIKRRQNGSKIKMPTL